MNIIINGQSYDGKKITGIGNYIKGLLEEFDKLEFSQVPIVFCRNWDVNLKNLKFYKSIGEDRNILIRILWENLYLPLKIIFYKPDLFHSTNYTIPFFLPKSLKVVATVHDINWRIYPNLINRFSYLLAIIRMKHTCKRADKIIAISESTKKDLIKYFNCDSKKISVIYQGVDPRVFNENRDYKKEESIKEKYHLDKKYFFWIGSIRKNKNVPRMCEFFLSARKKLGIDFNLVIAGNKSNDYHQFAKYLSCEGIKYIGEIEDDEITSLYKMSSGLIFLSLYEGFGFPVLESIYCKRPLIASNLSSLPELVEDKQMLIDPLSEREFLEALKYIVSIDDDEAIMKNYLKVKDLTRHLTARKTLSLYKDSIK